MKKPWIVNTLFSKTSIAPLAMFRVLFGCLLFFSTVRFWLKGWIESQYIEPTFFFKYYGFEWVQSLPAWGMYSLFVIMAISAIGIALGLLYRISTVLFFISFTYVELIDVSNYLNHYYFVSLMAFLLLFLPAHKNYSLDAKWGLTTPVKKVQRLYLLLPKIQLFIVYFYAGLAKLNSQWLLEALPLKIWLPAQQHLPVIGNLLTYEWVAFAFSWGGALYDLSIPFLLFYKKTRPYAFVAVLIFHVLTWLLFPIGVFPWVMIFSTLIFFSAHWHRRLFSLAGITLVSKSTSRQAKKAFVKTRIISLGLGVFMLFQLLFPFRYLLYGGNLFWTEQGYRFSWRVMLMEKAGYATFYVLNPANGKTTEVNPQDFLTVNQNKQMATQPDLILQFAHFLEAYFEAKGVQNPEIRAKVYVSLNGAGNQLFIDPNTDLTKVKDSFAPKTWIVPNA